MLLKIPTRSLNEEITTELFSTEIDDQNQMKKITNQVDQIKYVICYFSKSNVPVDDALTIRISISFLRKYHSDFDKIALSFFEEKSHLKPKYPVKLQFAIDNRSKELLETDLDFLSTIFSLQKAQHQKSLKTFELILLAFHAVETNQDLFCDFVTRFLVETAESTELEAEAEADEKFKCCGVCGSEVETGPFSFYGEQFTRVCWTAVCQKCIKFYEMSLNTDRGGWRCLQQSGYCHLLDTFQYSSRPGVLLYTARDGTVSQYVSNCNVLCRPCRYRRCVHIGLSGHSSQEQEQKERVSCLVCGSQQPLTSLQVCGCCQEFLSDSVSESSHTTMTCLKSCACLVTSAKTETFSACPGCWMTLLRNCGVLDRYLASLPLPPSDRDDSEKENQEKCLVCQRPTAGRYKEKILCQGCKKFFLKCAKSLCFKDFCCGESSPCSLAVRSPCPHCWWRQCVQAGLYHQYQQARTQAASRQSASLC